MDGPPRNLMNIIVKFPKEEYKRLIQPLINLFRYEVLQTKSKQTRGQAEGESIMGPSSHMKPFIEEFINNTTRKEKKGRKPNIEWSICKTNWIK